MIRLGMVDLCTSHPGSWIPIIKEMDAVEVVALHDDGGVRPEGYAPQFAQEHGIGIHSIRLKRPTLDDVYLHYTGREIREAEGSREELIRTRVMSRRIRR